MAARGDGARVLSALSYIAVVATGFAFALAWILGAFNASTTLVGALLIIAEVIMAIVVICYSYRYAQAKGTWWLVAWAVSVVLIIIFRGLLIFEITF